MNREVEERIVAMYFDNQDFEKNAQTTINTLGQLKQGLNLEDNAAKGFSVFEKLGKVLNFDKSNRNLTTMKNKLSSMSGALGKIFKIGNAPLKEAESALSSLRGYVNKVFGIDLASKIVGGLENAFRSLTVVPIGQGWDQYQSKMDSVKTIMSSTGESIDVVEHHLEHMTDYANKTIYSLTDMTSNLGKFTNNGVELESAVKSMEGIANAAAFAGQGAQQASMAMYNISQAIGVGKMTTIDWKSIENANMATGKLKETFLEVAAAAGKLKKETKDVGGKQMTQYFLERDEDGKKLKERIELTTENFREYLSKGWLDKQTMLRTFEIFSGEGIDKDTLQAWGFEDEETIKSLLDLGQKALDSATQVRTFTKMMDALKESVQSGWAKSFETIFGNMEEGTQLWTDMNEKIEGILTAATNNRNDILKEWATMTEAGEYFTRDENNNTIRTGIEGGRDILINTVFEMMDVIQNFSSMVSEAFGSVFGKLDAKALFNVTIGFRNMISTIRDWLGSISDSGSRLSKLQTILRGFFNILKGGVNIFKALFNLGVKLIKPILDPLLDVFSRFFAFFEGFGNLSVGEMFERLYEGLKIVWGKIKKLFTVKPGEAESPITGWLKSTWDGFKKIVREWMQDIGLEGVVDKIDSLWATIRDWPGWTEIASFFGDIWGWLSKKANVVIGWFTSPEEGVESGFVKFINSVASKISRIWGIITGWEGWEKIGLFFSDIWAWIKDKTGLVIDWFTVPGNGEKTGFAVFIDEVASEISRIWGIIAGWEGWEKIGLFFSDIFGWIRDKTGMVINWFSSPGNGEKSGFVQFISDAASEISRIWGVIVNWEGWNEIGRFFGSIWEWIREKTGSVMDWFSTPGDGSKSGFVQFVESAASGISRIWGVIVNWKGWEKIGLFFGDIFAWIREKTNKVIDWFTPPADGTESGFVTFLKDVKGSVESAWEEIAGWSGWSEIGTFFDNIWNSILGFFNGETAAEESAASAADRAGTTRNADRLRAAADRANGLVTTISDVGKGSRKADASTVEERLTVFQRLSGILTGFFDSFAKVAESIRNNPEINAFLGAFGEFFSGLVHVMTEVMSRLGSLMKGNKSLKNLQVVIIPGLIAILTSIFDFINNGRLAKIAGTQNFAQKFLEIAGGLFLMATAVGVLTALDQSKIGGAVGAIVVIGAVVSVIVALLTKLNSSRVANAPVKSGERILNNLITAVGKIGMIATAMALLPNIIRTIGEVKSSLGGADFGEDALKIMLGLSALIASVSIVMAVVQKMTGNSGLSIAATVKTVLSILSAIGLFLLAFTGGGYLVSLIGEDAAEDVAKKIDDYAKVMRSLGGAIGGFIAALIGGGSDTQKTEQALGQLDQIAEASKAFDQEKISGISRMMALISQLTENSAAFNTDKLKNFASAMGEMGSGIYEIAGYLQETEGALSELSDPESEMTKKLQGFVQFGTALGGMLESFSNTNLGMVLERLHSLATVENSKQFVNDLQVMLNALGTLKDPNQGIQFDGLTIATRLVEAIQSGLNNKDLPAFDATTIIDNILSAIGLGSSAIALAVHEMVQNGMNLSGTGANGEGYNAGDKAGTLLSQILNGGNIDSILNVDQFSEQLFGKDGEGGIMGEINKFEEMVPSMSSIFSDKGWMNFSDENGNEIDILSSVQEHIGTLNETLNTMDPLEIRITPVFDFDNLTADSLMTQLGMQSVNLPVGVDAGKMQVDFSGLGNELNISSIRTSVDNVRSAVATYGANTASAVSNLASHMDSIASAVASIRLYLDTGALVGGLTPYIDAAIYQRSWITSRTGTPLKS